MFTRTVLNSQDLYQPNKNRYKNSSKSHNQEIQKRFNMNNYSQT